MNITKQQMTIIAVVLLAIAVWYFFLRKKEVKEESNFKWPRWLKISGCRPCVPNTTNCCNGCVCKDPGQR